MDTRDSNRNEHMLDVTSSRRQALKLMGGGLVGGIAMAAGIKGVTAQRNSQRGPTGGPGSWSNEFTGTVLEGDTAGEEFTGVMEITRFSNKGGVLTASGNVYQDGTFVDTFTAAVNEVLVDPVLEEDASIESTKLASVATDRASDVSLAQDADCQILYLELAPLYLDVLGLVIELPNALILDIYAVEGGGLLGDLLCSIGGLLEGGGPLQQITGLLNQILGILSQLGG